MPWQRFAVLELRSVLRDSYSRCSVLRCGSCVRKLQTVQSTSEVPTQACVAKPAWTTVASVRWLPVATKEAMPVDVKPAVKKTEITYEELSKLVDAGTLHLIDVREPADVNESGIIKSAVNIPLTKLKASLQLDPAQFEAQYNATKPARNGENMVFYGFSSVKSAAAVEIAHKLGFKKAQHFPGGWEQWSGSRKKL